MHILIRWNKSYELNIKEIDQQHMKLINLINILYDSFLRKEHDNVLEQTISELKDYAFVHFKEEEKYFEQVMYEDSSYHIAEHQYFLDSVERFQQEYLMHNQTITPRMINFLKDWFTHHILNSDKKYVASFFRHGIK